MMNDNGQLPRYPNMIKDLFRLANYFYQTSPSIKSRILSVSLKHSLDLFVFFNSPLAKDANPVSSNVLREIGGLFTTGINVYYDTPHSNNQPALLQDTTHLLGQAGRLACKLSFQLLGNSSNSVELSRFSNIACDAIGLMATDISKTSQQSGTKLYYFWQNLPTEIYGVSYALPQLTARYVMQAELQSVFKGIAIDLSGQIIKSITLSSLLNESTNFINSKSYELIEFGFNLPNMTIKPQANIYNQIDAMIEVKNSSISSYIAAGSLAAYRFTSKALPDLLVTGIIMLSIGRGAADYVGDIIKGNIPYIGGIKTIASVSFIAYYSNEIIQLVTDAKSELITLSVAMVTDDGLYNLVISNPLLLAGSIAIPLIDDYVNSY